MTRIPRRAIALAIAVTCLLGACGDDDTSPTQSGDRPDTTDASGGDFPVTITADNGEVEIAARPERIVSLSPTGTEMLFAIGAGDQVVAVDDFSYYPPEAPVTDLSGWQPNIEAIAEFDPDLVVISTETGDVIESLERLDITVVHFDAPATFDGIYTQIEALGVATGHVGDAAELVGQMQTDIAAIVEGLPDDVEGLTYFHELDETLYSVTSSTFIGQVYDMLGLVNIADAADPDGTSGGYPQLSEEFVIEADPDLIFLADAACCGQSAETVAARPGWASMTALETGGVIEVDEDVASRWGPRIVDYLADVADAVRALERVS
ncbi:MAG: ABC transporter substrate-binding protein [Acidimicrobiales bacterium]